MIKKEIGLRVLMHKRNASHGNSSDAVTFRLLVQKSRQVRYTQPAAAIMALLFPPHSRLDAIARCLF